MTLNPITVEFRNLPVGYYFLYNDEVFIKVNPLHSLQLYSYLTGINYFTNTFTPYFDIQLEELDINKIKQNKDTSFNIHRGSNVNVSLKKITDEKPTTIELNPNALVGFVKREDLTKYIVHYYNQKRTSTIFDNIEIGGFFFYAKENKYYKKISYYNAMPIYNDKYGLDNNENINISIVTSAIKTINKYNNVYYNGENLINFDFKAWNILTFSENFKTYKYKSFDAEKHWTTASNEMLEFIEKIDDNELVFISNSNDSLYTKNLGDNKVKLFNRIYDEQPKANNILSSIGLSKNIINNIYYNSAILLICRKNKEILFYDKVLSHHPNMKYEHRDNATPYILEYTYHFSTSDKSTTASGFKTFNLDDKVISSNMKEVTFKLLYDLPATDPRSVGDVYGLYDI